MNQNKCTTEAEIKVLTKEDTTACGFVFTSGCVGPKLPDGDFQIGVSEDCETEPCPTCTVVDGEPIEDGCTVVGRLAADEEVGCDWLPSVCIPSLPPAIGCAPIFGGEGGYDGGVPEWTGNCLDDCDLAIMQATRTNFQTYIQGNWEHVLDLATHPERTSQLMVRHEGNPREINTQEWHALAYKLARTAITSGAFKEFANQSNIGIAYVNLGPNSYGLTSTVNGEAVGSPLPLVSVTNGAGDVIGLNFPLPV